LARQYSQRSAFDPHQSADSASAMAAATRDMALSSLGQEQELRAQNLFSRLAQ
jgi:hypothetical protein